MYVQRMNLVTQRAPLVLEREVTLVLKLGYAVSDCGVFTVISGAPSVHRRWGAAFFMSTREENFLSAYGIQYRQV